MPVYLPHQLIEHQVTSRFDKGIRSNYFRGMDFAGPEGDPGWFGPDSAVWHVHSHTPALIFGLQCAAYLERLDPSIYWMGVGHSRLVDRDADGNPTGRLDPEGAAVRLGHSLAFFIGTAYGSTQTAERLAHTVRAMHHTVKGVRPDGLPYDADHPDWLRWNYATVVWGIATAHEMYHPRPLRGKALDRYYGEFVRVGQALGGTDLPATKDETHACLKSYLPKLALTHGAAMATGPNLIADPFAPAAAAVVDWAMRDVLPKWAAAMVMYSPPNIIERTARRAGVWMTINGFGATLGEIDEFRQAKARVAGGTVCAPTEPSYTLGSDDVLTREAVEEALT